MSIYNVVYWLYDHTCKTPEYDGYVGITNNIDRRLQQHRKRGKRFPEKYEVKILFTGTREECLREEERLRPDHLVGWNVVRGGRESGRESGYKHKPETIEKIRKRRLGFVVSNATKEKISQTLKGSKLQISTKQKLYEIWRSKKIFSDAEIETIRNDSRGSRTLAKVYNVDRKTIIKIRKRQGIYSDIFHVFPRPK